MPKSDKTPRGFKSSDFQRRELKKKLYSFNTIDTRLGFAVIMLFIALISDPSPLIALVFVGVLSVTIARIILHYKKRRGTNPNEIPYLDVKRQKPSENRRTTYQAPVENFNIESNNRYVKSKSFSDYSCNVIDPWDIKDEKPPWEL